MKLRYGLLLVFRNINELSHILLELDILICEILGNLLDTLKEFILGFLSDFCECSGRPVFLQLGRHLKQDTFQCLNLLLSLGLADYGE
jgi:hypothetical protein